MQIYQKMLENLPAFEELQGAISKNRLPAMVIGLSSVHKAHFVYGLAQNTSQLLLVVCEDEQNGKKMSDDVNAMAGKEIACLYPSKEFHFRQVESVSEEYEQIRLGILAKLVRKEIAIVFASIEALLQYTLPKKELLDRSTTIKAGQAITLNRLLEVLSKAGYSRRPQVDGISQYSVRGGIVDIYPPGSPAPVRIEFWGDEIDTISYFELDSQRRTEHMHNVEITPASEVLFNTPAHMKEQICGLMQSLTKTKHNILVKEKLQRDIERIDAQLDINNLDKYIQLAYQAPATLFDYLDNPLVCISEIHNVEENSRAYLKEHQEDIKQLLEEGELCGELSHFCCSLSDVQRLWLKEDLLYFDTFARSNPGLLLKTTISITTLQTSGWSGEIKQLIEDLTDLLQQNYVCVIMSGTKKAGLTLAKDMQKENMDAVFVEDTDSLHAKKIYVIQGNLSSGFEYPDNKVALITNKKINHSSGRKAKKRKGEEIRSLSDINVGDLVVHTSHGIGRFDGIQKLEIQGITKDYIKIKYKGEDVLYVPVTQLDLVSKYIGPKEGGNVRLNKLNSSEWNKTKSRVKQAVAEMADELIQLYAQRAKTKGYAFSQDNEWQKEFEERFEYEETDDQLRCVDEIKEDMESSRPMDRLLCGDVGFGKTEVALRAAFKCVLDSKQCAILCPTTILAWQHYQNILKRIGDFPIKVELLSRFRSAKEAKRIVGELKNGEIDIIVGTHKLIQKSVKFKDIGLAIIDEEQRFGVTHKERFKEIFAGVDVLTLSATPIPRTLNMAMSGIRDMSVIEQAPQDRYPVQTYVMEHDNGVVAQALKRELRRGGQVYYIHNRIETIEQCGTRLQDMLPDARIAIAHGQMGEKELSKKWEQLMNHEIDILVCTTIIETGVDVSNCNTLVIESADKMGLAQLYQLRGRVGRSNRRAYAYFTFPRGKVLTEVSAKRLEAIREFTKFGSGFRIALRDLEIRGAGSILGARQHGHMEAVGYDMYLRLLADTVNEKQGKVKPQQAVECLVDIQIQAHIPDAYIVNLSQRIDVYRKIASVKTEEERMDMLDELIDRFGEPPASVKGLLDVAMLRNTAAGFGFSEINQQGSTLLFYSDRLDMELAAKLSAYMRGRVMVNAGKNPYIAVKMQDKNKNIEAIQEVLLNLQKLHHN